MKSVLITGSNGLIGSACVEKFASEGWKVIGLDNNMRGQIFGDDGSTKKTGEKLSKKLKNSEFIECDIRDNKVVEPLIEGVDAVVHCAAQPSHPRSLEIPLEDFQINAWGTLNLLEMVRKNNPDIPFAFMSTNKVYGDAPNFFRYEVVGRRFENTQYDSFDEKLQIDHCGHTPFGVSKVAADLYCQEYAINYGLKTATFRGGCLIGSNQKAVEMHGFLGFFTKQILLKNKLKLYGGGLRVRDNIHSSDVAEVLHTWVCNPRPNQLGKYGTAYNLGGMRENSVSIFETIDACEAKTGFKAIWEEAPERESDHIWWISDMSRFKKDYPLWKGLTKDLDYIFNELLQNWIDVFGLKVKLKEKDYFRKIR
ncbi:MAG: NAD-dependent epimerase/dehydratase family protein [Candidatus Altiarchaeota archaeon]|nr:NAD-dependent epimerase/dehydratase family protein [Candidatus Altiarchaeota archaeon]